MNTKQKKVLGGLPVVLILAIWATFFAPTPPGLVATIWAVIAVGLVATVVAYWLAGRSD